MTRSFVLLFALIAQADQAAVAEKFDVIKVTPPGSCPRGRAQSADPDSGKDGGVWMAAPLVKYEEPLTDAPE